MSFDDFRKTVRRAGIRPGVLSDDELQRIVEIVDSDGRYHYRADFHPPTLPALSFSLCERSGQIDLDEFLAFMRPTSVPDVKCTASSWLQRTNSTDRHPQNLVSTAGVSVTDDNCYIHTGEIDGTAWTSEEGPPAAAWVEFELPQVRLVDHAHAS